MDKKKQYRQLLLTLLVVVFSALCFFIAYRNRSFLSRRPVYSIESSSEVRFGKDGQTIVLDNGKKTILLLDGEGRLKRWYEGGSEESAFFYACDAAQAADGSIYVADIIYGNRGNLLDRERIIRLSGSKAEVLYEIDYRNWETEDTPLQYGRILELQEHEGSIFFLLDTVDFVELKRLDPDGTVSDLGAVPAGGVKNSASYDAVTGKIAVIERSGSLSVYDLDGGIYTAPIQEGLMPYDISARNGEVFYTELQEQAVRHFTQDGPGEDEVFSRFDTLPFKLDVSGDGLDVMVSDQVGFYRLMGSQEHVCSSSEYVDSAPVSRYVLVIMVWAALILGGIGALYLILKMAVALLLAASKNENALRISLVVAAALSVSFVLASSLMSQFLSESTDTTEQRVALFGELLMSQLDKGALLELNEPSDHETEEFRKLKEPLDQHTWNSYSNGDYFYYILYRSIGGYVVMVMDFEDTMPCARPMYIDDPLDNDYSSVLHTGKQFQISEISAYGSWSFQLSPIYGKDGEIIGELEVGLSLDSLQRRQNEMRMNLLLDTAVSTTVISMMVLELTFLIAFLQRKREAAVLDNAEKVPVRTMMFLSYMADSMQDAFIAILCTKLYQGGLPVPKGVAVAFPMSVQLFMMAVFSLFAGRMVEKYGSRRVLTSGMLIQLSGFLCCLILGSYWGILAGKMLIGAGMGTVYVSCNTIASSGTDEKKAAAAFAGVSAGTISGLTIGAGLSSILLSLSGWRLIYLIGAVIAGAGVLLGFFSADIRITAKAADDEERKGISFSRFFLNRRVVGFFLLILVPFMMALSYREYFFPLFAQENGIGEIRIAQLYLLCGMIVIYIGPYLSALLLKNLGALWSVVCASALMGLDMLLFVVWPTLPSVIAGVLILSVVISFAYTCQYTYFERTPECPAYGEGRSMGIYSVFESLGQTVGPMAYGALLALGYRKGIGVFCVAMFVLVLLFALLMRRSGRRFRDEE